MIRTPDLALAAAGRVAQRVLEALPDLLERLGAMYRAEVDEYARMPSEDLHREVLQVTRSAVEHFLQTVVTGRQPHVVDQLGLVELGRRRMEMGVSLDAMLHVFRISGRGFFSAVVEHTQEGDEAALGLLGSWWLEYLDSATSAAAVSYLHASHDRVAQIEARARALVEAVLAVDGPGEAAAVAAEFSVQLAEAYVPCCLPATARRDALSARTPAGALLTSRDDALLVLLPAPGPAAGLLTAAQVPVLSVGRARRLGPDLRAEVVRAEAVLAIALRRGARGEVGPGDFVVEQLLAAGPAVADELRQQVLQPLLAHDTDGVLQRTLEAYLDSGSLTATARVCFTHPNTVTYRLRRTAQLTGLDPRVPRDAVRLALALATR